MFRARHGRGTVIITGVSDLRATILLQSALSGAVVGLVAGAVLFAFAVGVWALLPDSVARAVDRVRIIGALVCFVVLPLVGAALGWLEGRLKL